jgi:hypothetical protein
MPILSSSAAAAAATKSTASVPTKAAPGIFIRIGSVAGFT